MHAFHIINPKWHITRGEQNVKLLTPELLVDGIYQSMDGPQAMTTININKTPSYQWLTGFKTEVFKEGSNRHNNDFLCHTNIDYFDLVHYKNLKLPKRINQQYPRLGTLSNGINTLNFPEGFGFPVAVNEQFLVASRTLNHNVKDAFFKVTHQIDFTLKSGSTSLKPLTPRALVLLQNYNHENPEELPTNESNANMCLPLDLKNHSYPNKDGVTYAAHWVLPQGTHKYVFDVSYQMEINEDTTVHAMAAHLHPHAKEFMLYDVTENKVVYNFKCTNYKTKIGLKEVPVFSSSEGIPLYKDHSYQLILITENPSENFRDMMAVLYLYLYDKEMDEHLQNLALSEAEN